MELHHSMYSPIFVAASFPKRQSAEATQMLISRGEESRMCDAPARKQNLASQGNAGCQAQWYTAMTLALWEVEAGDCRFAPSLGTWQLIKNHLTVKTYTRAAEAA